MDERPLRVVIKDHQFKSAQLAVALARAGHLLNMTGSADVLLIDADVPMHGYRQLIDRYKDAGTTVLLYPHGGGVQTGYDGLYEPYERVDGNLVTAPGHVEVLRRLEYPVPAHVIGWSMCEMRPLRRVKDVRRVVFGPAHPSGIGYLPQEWKDLNAKIFAELLEQPWGLTVRHIGDLAMSGLWHDGRVKYVRGDMSPVTTEIDAADVVVASVGTFPCLALARGVPTVMYGQGDTIVHGLPGEKPTQLLNKGDHLTYARYPFDAADGPIGEVVCAATTDRVLTENWRSLFIGRPFDEVTFPVLVERLVRQARLEAVS